MKKAFLIIIVFIFLIVALPLRTLDTWMPADIRLDTGDAAGANESQYPQIACSESNVYAVWEDYRNGSTDIYYNYSIDGGTNWNWVEFRLDTGDVPGASSSYRPQITCTTSYVYVVWYDYRNGSADIYFNYSSDNGANWQSSDIRLDTGDVAGANVSLYPQIACAGSQVYVVWVDARNGSTDIYYNYSTDNGANWQSSAIRLDTGDTPGANDSWYPQISECGNNVYVVWQDSRNGSDDIYFNYSADLGVTWQSSDIRLDTGDAAGANGSGSPQITCTGSQVYVVWGDNRNGANDIYFNYSTDYGATWQTPDIRLDKGDTPGADNSILPQISCSGNNVYVVWQDCRNGSFYDIYFNYSIDYGATWQSPDVRLDTGDVAGAYGSTNPQITCTGSHVYAVWQDHRNNGLADIYYNYSTDYGASWQTPDFRLDTGDTAGANDSMYPQITCSVNNVYAIWQDYRNGSYADIYFNRAIPWTDIKANGSDGPISITQSDTLQIRISLNTNGLTADADFWLAYKGPSGWVHYNKSTKSWDPGLGVTHQGALFDVNNKKVFQSSGLSPGTYRFYFGVDLNMNGNLTKSCLYYDEVKVTVTQ